MVKINSVVGAELHTFVSEHRLLHFIAGARVQRNATMPIHNSMPWQLLNVRVCVQHPNDLAGCTRIPGQCRYLTVRGNLSLGNLLYQVYDTLMKFRQHNSTIFPKLVNTGYDNVQAQFRIELTNLHALQLQCNLLRTYSYTLEKRIPRHLRFCNRCNEGLRRRIINACC